jgi:hypothetical protein
MWQANYTFRQSSNIVGKKKSSAAAQHETQLSDCQISSTSTGEEENRKSVIEGKNFTPLPYKSTTEDPETSL